MAAGLTQQGAQAGDSDTWAEVLGYVARLSPNIRRRPHSQAQGALTKLAALSEEEHEGFS
jgi:hypothetical protein